MILYKEDALFLSGNKDETKKQGKLRRTPLFILALVKTLIL